MSTGSAEDQRAWATLVEMVHDYSGHASPRLKPWPTDAPLLTRIIALLSAFGELVWLDLCGYIGFRAVISTVARTPLAARSVSYDALALVRVAVRDACLYYVKPVHCLQRSAAVTRLLRRRGIPAQLVIGYQPMPVHGHAWVELHGKVVWDHLSQLPFFRVLDRI